VNELDPRPILVTGVHRSGTTWVGKILAESPRVAYISEPLNVWHRPGVLRAPTRRWYTYICEDNQAEYLEPFLEMLAFDYHTEMEVRSIKSGKDLLRMGRDWSTFWKGRRNLSLPLVKDPFAVFSSEWFNSCLDCRVVVVVRHPAAVASSLMKLGWSFDFQDLLDQPLLMRDWLETFRDEMEQLRDASNNLIAQSCLLWRMVYQTIDRMRLKIPGLIVIRHEDFSLNPHARFEQLYRELNLEYTAEIQSAVTATSSRDNPKETSQRSIHSVRIDSQAIVKSWQRRLTREEIQQVRTLTAEVASLYYSSEDWQ
jgi:hypothetical protein